MNAHDRSKISSGAGKREDPLRQSQAKSTLSGSVMSEHDAEEEEALQANMTEKQKAARQKELERIAAVNAKLTPERTELRHAQINLILQQRDEKKNTPDFMDRYFASNNGQGFLARNPPQEVPEEVMTRMRQRIERKGKQSTDAGIDGDEGAKGSIEAGSNQQRSNDLVMVGEGMDDKDNPIVALEPDDNLKQGSAFMGSKKAGQSIGAGEASLQDPGVTVSGD